MQYMEYGARKKSDNIIIWYKVFKKIIVFVH